VSARQPDVEDSVVDPHGNTTLKNRNVLNRTNHTFAEDAPTRALAVLSEAPRLQPVDVLKYVVDEFEGKQRPAEFSGSLPFLVFAFRAFAHPVGLAPRHTPPHTEHMIINK